VFRATAADVPLLSAALARAFDDDPVMSWVFPDQVSRPARMSGLFELLLSTHHLQRGEVWAAEGHAGAAAWCEPDKWRIPFGRQVRNLPALVRLVGFGLFTRLRGLMEAERHHPTVPHWYLGVLGVEPEAQGTGTGSELLRPVLERCDAEGMGAYLESSKESNLAFYARHGFEVTERIPLGPGPDIWGMWRNPT
jgi:ribosomal protein S18 acetylase RimI-like enzyme